MNDKRKKEIPQEIFDDTPRLIEYLEREHGVDPIHLKIFEHGHCFGFRQQAREARNLHARYHRMTEHLKACLCELQEIVGGSGELKEIKDKNPYFLPGQHESAVETLGLVKEALSQVEWRRDWYKDQQDQIEMHFKGSDTPNLEKYLNGKRRDADTEAMFLRDVLKRHNVPNVGRLGAKFMAEFGYFGNQIKPPSYNAKSNDPLISRFTQAAARGAKKEREAIASL